MSKATELEPRTSLGEGIYLRYFIDHVKAENEVGRFFTEVTYDGQPGTDVFETPLHWHNNHDEWIEVVEGEADIILEGKLMRIRGGDEQVFIPRGSRHQIKSVPGVPLLLREKTNPPGRFKEDFFRDAFEHGFPAPALHMARAAWDGDTYLSVLPSLRGFDVLLNYVVGGLGKVFMPARRATHANG